MKSPTDFFVAIRESWRTIKRRRVFPEFFVVRRRRRHFPRCRSVAHVARDASSTCPAVPTSRYKSHPLTSSSLTSTTLSDIFLRIFSKEFHHQVPPVGLDPPKNIFLKIKSNPSNADTDYATISIKSSTL